MIRRDQPLDDHRLDPDDDDYDSRLSAFIKGHRIEINTVLDDLASLRSAANDEPYNLEDFAGMAAKCIAEGLRPAIPNFKRTDRV